MSGDYITQWEQKSMTGRVAKLVERWTVNGATRVRFLGGASNFRCD